MRKQFDLQEWIKDKSQRVETRDGRIVHNIWPVKEQPIFNGKRAEVCALIDGEEDALLFFEGGKYLPVNSENPFDLFIVTPEEELTEFEKTIIERVFHQKVEDLDEENKEIFREDAHLVLDLARKQLIKDGYVIEKKTFHDAVEKVDPEVMKEVSDNVDKENELSKKYLEGYTQGYKDAEKFFNGYVAYRNPTIPTTPSDFGCDGIRCTNPQMDCINCPRKTTGGFNTTCGTSTAALHGNTSATDGKDHNPSFTD